MHVIEHIKGIPLTSVLPGSVWPPVQNAELAAEGIKFRTPCILPMIGHIRASAGFMIQKEGFSVPMEDGIGFSEGNESFHKLKNISVCFCHAPVYPAGLVILTIGIIISALRIPKFIPCQNKRSSLTQKQHEECIAQLLFPQLLYLFFLRRAFFPAIP